MLDKFTKRNESVAWFEVAHYFKWYLTLCSRFRSKAAELHPFWAYQPYEEHFWDLNRITMFSLKNKNIYTLVHILYFLDTLILYWDDLSFKAY